MLLRRIPSTLAARFEADEQHSVAKMQRRKNVTKLAS
jgi:hypothetical protein